MGDKSTIPEQRVAAGVHQKRNEVLRTEGRPPETPVVGFRFGETTCLTPNCGVVVKYEIE